MIFNGVISLIFFINRQTNVVILNYFLINNYSIPLTYRFVLLIVFYFIDYVPSSLFYYHFFFKQQKNKKLKILKEGVVVGEVVFISTKEEVFVVLIKRVDLVVGFV